MDKQVARTLGRYELGALLGSGGAGALYEARDTFLDRAVALKVLQLGAGEAPGLAERLLHDSRLMAKVAHPSVITIYDVGREDDVVFLAMDLVRGETLRAWLASHRRDWRAVVAMFAHAGHGLAAAHGAGIQHRNFKPDNVLVAHGATKVVVTDFGIARAACTSLVAAAASLGAARATAAPTSAPEQLAGEPVDHRADIFAFSVSLWEAVFHALPFASPLLDDRRTPPDRPATAPRVPRRLVRALRSDSGAAPTP